MANKFRIKQFGTITLPAVLIVLAMGTSCLSKDEKVEVINNPIKNKIALNSYSFNAPLREGSMDLFDMLEYCSNLGFDGVDLTGYYFPGYPAPPSDEYIYAIKKRAFELGLHICGTGVKNNFCKSDPKEREIEKKLVKDWILVAEKLGAPAIRIFTGQAITEGYTWDQVSEWVTEDILECAAFGKEHGVVLEIQNHNDFLKTAEEVKKLFDMINSEWVGLMLDIGSYRTGNPYLEIAETIDLAVSWQLKEKVFIEQVETPLDLEKLKKILLNSDYKGFLPIETLGAGDPYVKIEAFYKKVTEVLK